MTLNKKSTMKSVLPLEEIIPQKGVIAPQWRTGLMVGKSSPSNQPESWAKAHAESHQIIGTYRP